MNRHEYAGVVPGNPEVHVSTGVQHNVGDELTGEKQNIAEFVDRGEPVQLGSNERAGVTSGCGAAGQIEMF